MTSPPAVIPPVRGQKIKVTINLPAELVKAAKIFAIEHNVNLQDVVAEGLRLILARKVAPAKGKRP